MSEPRDAEKNMRIAIVVALVAVVVIAPLVGVYAFSPLFFAWGLAPYQLAVAVSVMLAEAVAIALLSLLVFRAKR